MALNDTYGRIRDGLIFSSLSVAPLSMGRPEHCRSTIDPDTCHFLVAEYYAMCHRSSRRGRLLRVRLLRVMPHVAISLVACLVDSIFQRERHVSSCV